MLCTVALYYGVRDGMFTVFFCFQVPYCYHVTAITSIAKSINVAIAILLKRSIGRSYCNNFCNKYCYCSSFKQYCLQPWRVDGNDLTA